LNLTLDDEKQARLMTWRRNSKGGKINASCMLLYFGYVDLVLTCQSASTFPDMEPNISFGIVGKWKFQCPQSSVLQIIPTPIRIR
jgi:hypothetical protein